MISSVLISNFKVKIIIKVVKLQINADVNGVKGEKFIIIYISISLFLCFFSVWIK